MYGYRYHIITCISVFLALGLGLLLGGTFGEQVIVKEQVQLLDRLEDRYTQAKAENVKLKQESVDLDTKGRQLLHVVSQVSDHYVQDRLPGKKVAILQLEPTELSALLTTLEKAGANVTSTTLITNSRLLYDPAGLSELGKGMAHAEGVTAQERQQRLLEGVVDSLYREGSDSTLLTELQEKQALTVNGTVAQAPDALILIGGAGDENRQRLLSLDVPLLKVLQSRGLTVVGTEPSEAAHSGVRYYREHGVSTVDNVDQTTGLVALIDVLGGAKGHFGVKKTAEALLPKLTNAKEVSAQ
ncbi:copper transporter [Tumebacillus lacus]|uniref:copper transporter n=1 Tax=Tumebacillus lacus TaxID=2995335 RepID=UPI002B204AD6|nr:copper transporter [Tumebacillus lacus]